MSSAGWESRFGLEGSKRASPVGLLSGPSGGLVALAQIIGRIELPAMLAPSVPDTWARRFVPRSTFFLSKVY